MKKTVECFLHNLRTGKLIFNDEDWEIESLSWFGDVDYPSLYKGKTSGTLYRKMSISYYGPNRPWYIRLRLWVYKVSGF